MIVWSDKSRNSARRLPNHHTRSALRSFFIAKNNATILRTPHLTLKFLTFQR